MNILLNIYKYVVLIFLKNPNEINYFSIFLNIKIQYNHFWVCTALINQLFFDTNLIIIFNFLFKYI
jgi:hypothetical protein